MVQLLPVSSNIYTVVFCILSLMYGPSSSSLGVMAFLDSFGPSSWSLIAVEGRTCLSAALSFPGCVGVLDIHV